MTPDPRHYVAHETLIDGGPVLIRAIRPDDKESLVQGFARLSPRSVYNRFFTAKGSLSGAELEYFTELDFVRHVALLAFVPERGTEVAVGIGRFIVDDQDQGSAEVALTVDDAHQGLGVGTQLFAHLAALGRDMGLAEFWAEVLASNRQMLAVFEHSGLRMRRTVSRGEVTVYLSLGA